MTFLTTISDFFLPRFCPSCKNKLITDEKYVCVKCINKIQKADEIRLQQEFERKFFQKKIITDFVSLFVFEKEKELQHIIHVLKYSKKFLYGIFLGEQLAKGVRNKIVSWNVSYIVPVPLHHLKKAERSFNQSFYIAKGISRALNIPVYSGILSRKKYTQSQTTMNIKEREDNIKEAFKIRKRKNLRGKNILIIDDVITTGATISECGKILLDAGADKIYAASVAIAD